MKNRRILILLGLIIIIVGIYMSLHYQPERIQNKPGELEEDNLLPGDQFKNVQLVFQ